MKREAIFDHTRKYRYSLLRIWNVEGPRVGFVMLNPSTADAKKDDPTIRRCINFALEWGYGSLEVVNLFAFRATSPKMLWKASDPIGTFNDTYLRKAADRAYIVVLAWGERGKFLDRGDYVRKMMAGQFTRCLGWTKSDQPKHPLYLRADTLPVFASPLLNPVH